MPTFLLSNPGFGQYSFVKEPLTIFRQSEVLIKPKKVLSTFGVKIEFATLVRVKLC